MRVVPVTWDVLTELVFNRTAPQLPKKDCRHLVAIDSAGSQLNDRSSSGHGLSL